MKPFVRKWKSKIHSIKIRASYKTITREPYRHPSVMAKRIVKNTYKSKHLQVSNVVSNQASCFFIATKKYTRKIYNHKISNILEFFYISRTTPYNKDSKSLHPTYYLEAASLYFYIIE